MKNHDLLTIPNGPGRIFLYIKDVSYTDGRKQHEAEHLAGLELLRRGLEELYGLRTDLTLPLQDDTADNNDLQKTNPSLPEMLETDAYGKPFLKDHPEIFFSISHCEGKAVCAFADGPVGVDIECFREIRPSLVRRVLQEEEQRVLAASADPETMFLRYWTLKESYLKQKGIGLRTEPNEILFHVDPEDRDAPVYGGDPETVCFQKYLEERYVLSVCCPRV